MESNWIRTIDGPHWNESETMESVHVQHTRTKVNFNVYRLAQPIYYISRLFGLLPFTLQCNDNGAEKCVTVTIFDQIWFAIALSWYAVLSGLCIVVSLIDYINEATVFLHMASIFLLFVGLSHGVFSIAKNMLQRHQFGCILNDLFVCDTEFHAMGMPVDHQRQYKLLIIILVLFFACTTVFVAITAYSFHEYHVRGSTLLMIMMHQTHRKQWISLWMSSFIRWIYWRYTIDFISSTKYCS